MMHGIRYSSFSKGKGNIEVIIILEFVFRSRIGKIIIYDWF